MVIMESKVKNERKDLSTPDYDSWAKIVTATESLPTRRFYFFVTQAALVGVAVGALCFGNAWVAVTALGLVFLFGLLAWCLHSREGKLDEEVGTTKLENHRRRLQPPGAASEAIEGGEYN